MAREQTTAETSCRCSKVSAATQSWEEEELLRTTSVGQKAKLADVDARLVVDQLEERIERVIEESSVVNSARKGLVDAQKVDREGRGRAGCGH